MTKEQQEEREGGQILTCKRMGSGLAIKHSRVGA